MQTLVHLQQQKLLRHYSHYPNWSDDNRSTIVEITQALQPRPCIIKRLESTIVEITQALQPRALRLTRCDDLQQQKLLRHYSLLSDNGILTRSTIVEITQALQPTMTEFWNCAQSTIVEITQALQPMTIKHVIATPSTIVEITQALQPYIIKLDHALNLQQQKLLRHYSRLVFYKIVL